MRQLEQLGVPRALFVNKMDQARGPLDALLAALAPVSAVPLVARQLPIMQDERVAGFVDLALERAFIYRPGQASDVVDLALIWLRSRPTRVSTCSNSWPISTTN